MKKSILLFVLFLSFSSTLLASTIGIIAALPAEIISLSKQEITEGQFIKTNISNHKVVMTLSGVGKVNAAMTAQKLISEYKVDLIIFSGVTGALNETYNIGDIIIADKVFQYDYGFLGADDNLVIHKPGFMPELGLGTGSESLFYNMHDVKNWDNILISLKTIQFDKINNYEPRLITGTVATGDQFVSSATKKKELVAIGADAVEMEGGAVAQVASANNVPCIIIRSISDKANHDASVDFVTFVKVAALNNSAIVKTILEKL